MPESATSNITHRGPVFDVEVFTWQEEDGREVRRDVVRHPGAVTIIPLLNSTQFVMIRNERIAVEEKLLEFPAGKIEIGEKPEITAARELIEETGYKAVKLTCLGIFFTSPGMSDECMHVYLADELQKASQSLQPGESIEVELFNIADVVKMAENGQIKDGKTLASLMLWKGISK